MAFSDPQGAVSASTQNSPGALAESPVERRAGQETGRVSERVHTRQTTTAHAAQYRRQRDPAGRAPSRGPERVRRGVSPTPLTPQRPAASTKSPVLGRPPCAPRSRPVNPRAQAPGMEKGTTALGKLTGAPRGTGPDEARRINVGPRGTPERHAAGHNQGTGTGSKQQRQLGAADPGSALNLQRMTAQEQVPGNTKPTHHKTEPGKAGYKERERTHTHTPQASQ